VPPGSRTFTVAKDGSISTEAGQIATLGVFNFSDADSKMMRRMGDATYLPTQGTAAVTEFPNVLQGFVETSNVNAVEEMTNMQMVSAAYQRSLTTMRGIEDLEQRAIRTLGGTQ
jgi:flagellar basal-body rod protein FlgF